MNEAPTRPSERPQDVLGKPFRVLASHFRECLVCEQTFSSRSARTHAQMPCWPATIPNSLLSRLGRLIH